MSAGLAAFFAGLAAFLAVYAAMAPVVELPRDPDPDLRGVGTVPTDAERPAGMFEKYVRPVIRNFLPQAPMGMIAKAREDDKIKALLVQSGNPWNIQPEEYQGVRVFAAVLGGFVGLILGGTGSLGINVWLCLLLFSLLGMYVPKALLSSAAGRRRKEAFKGLPEALDLLRICLFSSAPIGALTEVSQRMPEGIIKEEFKRVVEEVTVGRSLDLALADMARRAPTDEVQAFCKQFIQAMSSGTSPDEALAQQSEAARRAYEAQIDEKINRLQTIMPIPVTIFMVPALFLVLLAPAFSSITSTF